MQNSRGDVMSRLGVNQTPRKGPTVEFVNRAGQRVNPHNGKPYSRPNAASAANGNNPTKRRRPAKGAAKQKLPVKMFGIMFGGLAPIPTNPTVDPPPRVCYNCWQPGHARKNCPRPAIAKICNNCGRRGEDLSTCPRCKVAHLRYLAHLNGEKLSQHDLEELFPRGYTFAKNGHEQVYSEEKPYDIELQQVIDNVHTDYQNYDQHEPEVYRQPLVKYVETREYVRNPVSRHQQIRPESEDEEEARRRYDYEERDRERERSYERDRVRERSYEREDYTRDPYREPSEDRSVERHRRSYSDLDSDPVQEVLELAKSIAHLSPETQELIMKQVMAERKEKARLRAMKHNVVEEDWP